MPQDKEAEVKFWDKRALKRAYAAFLDGEYTGVMKIAVGEDLKGKKILDIGCASGKSSVLFADAGAEVCGIDISPMLIGQARQIWGERGDKVNFSIGDSEKLEFPDNTFDVCYFAGVLHHLPDRRPTIAEAFRVLKEGGKIVAIEPNKRDFLERFGYVMAGLRGDLTPNEAPIDPRQLSYELSLAGFKNPMLGTFRQEIPWFGLYFPKASRTLVSYLKRWRQDDHHGTFFMIDAVKQSKDAFWADWWDNKISISKNNYEATARGSSPEIEFFWTIHHIATKLELNSNDVLLDAACGTGIMALLLAPFVEHIDGFDFSEKAIEIAHNNIGDIGNVTLDVGLLTNIKTPSERYTKVLSHGSIQYLGEMIDVERCLREFYRVMKPGGRALLGNNPDKNHRQDYLDAVVKDKSKIDDREKQDKFLNNIVWFDREEFVRLAESIGFKAWIVEIPSVIFQSLYMFDLLLVKP